MVDCLRQLNAGGIMRNCEPLRDFQKMCQVLLTISNYKLSIANEMNVVFSCHIVLPEELQVNSFDLTVILGNLLDNALNALKEAKVKQLNIDINYSIGMIVIKIENTFANISSKYDDPEKHGYGLISVRTSLEKYNGKLQNNIVDDKYVVKAVLYNVVKKS